MTKEKKAEIRGKSTSFENSELKVFEGYVTVDGGKEDEDNSS